MGGFNSRAHGARDMSIVVVNPSLRFQFTRARGARLPDGVRDGRQISFNSRAHGARDLIPGSGPSSILFQFTRARGARLWGGYQAGTPRRFQFTRARGARLSRPRWPGILQHRFNSRAHGARDTDVPRQGRQGTSCFNSRAHGARDLRAPRPAVRGTVSIHARTGRATIPPPQEGERKTVSIHARTGRATTGSCVRERVTKFQFTRARGARPATEEHLRRHQPFQFTRARGARHQLFEGCCDFAVSIHARTGRATDVPRQGRQGTSCFNSRAHGARDLRAPRPAVRDNVSIHARTGRATIDARSKDRQPPFQFTRARGARLRKMRGKTRIGRWRGECSGTGADGKCAKKAHNGLFSCHRTGAGRREPTGVGMWAWGSRRGKKGQMDRRSVSGSGAGLAP